MCGNFSQSSKRHHNFQLMKGVVNLPRHKMVKLSQTRWFSREKVVAKILEQLDALALLLQGEADTDKGDGAASMSKIMMTHGTKHTQLFFHYILGKVDKNVQFQAQYFRFNSLYSTAVSDQYRSIFGIFIQGKATESVKLT